MASVPRLRLLPRPTVTDRNDSTFELTFELARALPAGRGRAVKILVDRLTESPRRYDFEADPAWWENVRARLPELGPARREDFRFELTAYLMGKDVYVEGVAHGLLELECGRCLARYASALREPFRLVLEPAGERVPAEPEAAEALARTGLGLGDDIETGWFRGRELDLGPFLLEVVTLALPVQPLCREDCRGLCPRCGVDRNQVSCGCEEAKPASPFAALRVFRRDSNEGES